MHFAKFTNAYEQNETIDILCEGIEAIKVRQSATIIISRGGRSYFVKESRTQVIHHIKEAMADGQ